MNKRKRKFEGPEVIWWFVGIFTTVPTAAQLAPNSPLSGTHTFGVAEGGPSLPILGWSTIGGDGRVAHFVGLHALQVLPLIGWWIGRRSRLNMTQRIRLVKLVALGYGAIVALLAWQALRGQSIVAPDALTLRVFAFGSIAVFLASVATLMLRGSSHDQAAQASP
jgi:hypothetical protein